MTLIILLLILTIIVCVHELGHLIAAKIFGVYCHEYAIGMGPVIWKHKFKETTFSIRALPIGGFVKMAGEPDDKIEAKTDDTEIPYERRLVGVAKWKQTIIMLAGVFMNFVLAFVVMVGGYMTYQVVTPEVLSSTNPVFETGDVLLYKDGVEIITVDDIAGSETAVFTIERDGQQIDVEATYNDENKLGITLKTEGLGFINSVKASYGYCVTVSGLIFEAIRSLVTPEGYQNIGGVISMYGMVSGLSSLVEYLAILAMLSINVGIFNALPLPIMDGGRVLLLVIEAIRKKPLSDKEANWVFGISFVMIIALFIFVTGLDIARVLGWL